MKISNLTEMATPASMPDNNTAAPKFGRSDEMLESGVGTSVAGGMAPSAKPMGKMRTRGQGSMFKGISTSSKYANSAKAGISEDSVNEDELSEEQLQAKKRREENFKKAKDRELGNKPVSRDIMAKEAFNGEYDDEAGMADNNLETLRRAVDGIDDVIGAGDNLPEWCQEKIAVAKSMLVTVWDYMRSEEEIGEAPTVDEAGPGIPFRGVGGAFNRGDDERHDLDTPKPTAPQVWGLKINGKVWSKAGKSVTFTSKEAALKSRDSILKSRPDLEIGLVTKGGQKGVAEGGEKDRQWSNKDTERLRVATRDFDDIMASDGPDQTKHDLIKKRIQTKPMAGPKGVLPEQGMAEGSLKEFAPVGGDDREPDEEEILRQLAAQWWNGTEQQMAKAQKTLAAMGWEIGQDESGDDDAGVFVIRAGDINGDSYIAFNHSELNLNEGGAEGFNDDNFTIDDIHKLEQIKDFETLKARAKDLIKGKPARRMKPEKIAYFYDRVDTLTSPMKVIKMMYDLLLAGEGMKTIGSQNSTNPNVYQRRFTEDQLDELKCWSGYHRVAGTKAGFPGSCAKNKTNEDQHSESCPHCGGEMVSEELMNEKKDACYYKVKSRYKVWPSAYASGALVKCRNKGASNWGNKSESMTEEELEESLHDWFNKEKWVRMDTKGKIKGSCAREPGEGKPKCLPQAKAYSLGKKGRASAAARKRREDPNPERSGQAINVNTKKKS